MLRIEVAVPAKAPNKEKGDLLEDLARDFLRFQNYEVNTQVRVTGSELDLLCKHKVNKRTLYVECKAHRENLSSKVLINLLGTITLKGYDEGWLISAGPLGSDAKGFQSEWEGKSAEESQKLSIYTPERVLDALVNARVLVARPESHAVDLIDNADLLGSWLLLISPFGRFWLVTCLSGGVPEGVLVYSAKTGDLIREAKLLRNLAKTDTSVNELDFEYISRIQSDSFDHEPLSEPISVVEVQHGDSWTDYRPARPQDFVGRRADQARIIDYLKSVRNNESRTRVFAITGDSGMGKSSLIAKLRNRLANRHYRRRFFLYAVDVRAAKSATYVFSSLLSCLRVASKQGYGSGDEESLRITNPTEPLDSPTIQQYLRTLEQKQQVVCLVFDQFEELYSKPELFPVFEVAQRLFLSATSAQSNFVLGFAWKSDSTVQQSHPAYYMWHRLTDHRIEVELTPFRHSEASKAITVFQNELGETILVSLRRQLIENSQGYPWLLKKLCIHLYDQIRSGASQSELMDKALDIESLFKRDLQNLTQPEMMCLRLIANTGPADWYEILETSDRDTLRALIDKRLVVRSGDRLNVYWDIFREYVVTGNVPSIPLTYLPDHTSLRTTLMVAEQLDSESPTTYFELSESSNLRENTVGNIVRDLIMFGVAKGEGSEVKLDDRIDSSDPENVLRKLRQTLRRHALTLRLKELDEGTVVSEDGMIDLLKEINPAAQHRERTWKAYADRMGQWLTATGYIKPHESGWKLEDRGDIDSDFTKVPVGYYRKDNIFIGDTSPAKAVDALGWIFSDGPRTWSELKDAGYRNAATSLRSLGVITNVNGKYVLTDEYQDSSNIPKEIVWRAAKSDPTLLQVVGYLRNNPTASGSDVGRFVNVEHGRNWSVASMSRVGNSLRKWAKWLILGDGESEIPRPLGQAASTRQEARQTEQRTLFDD